MTTYSEALTHNQKKLGRAAGPYAEGFTDFLTAAVLAKKRYERFGDVQGANSTPANLEYKGLVRNVCVRVDALRVAELDALMQVFGCSKQEFLIELLSAGIEQAKTSLESQGVLHAYTELVDRLVAESGFSMKEASNGFLITEHEGKVLTVDKA